MLTVNISAVYKYSKISAFMLLTLFLSACQVPPLDVYYSMNDHIDFSQYETFSVTSTTISDTTFLDAITRNMSMVLSEKGFQKVEESKADLVVAYHIVIHESEKLVQQSIPVKGNIYTRSSLEAVYEAQILVNAVDTKTKMVVWKASSSRDLTNINNSTVDEEKVYARMLELLASFPSR